MDDRNVTAAPPTDRHEPPPDRRDRIVQRVCGSPAPHAAQRTSRAVRIGMVIALVALAVVLAAVPRLVLMDGRAAVVTGAIAPAVALVAPG